MTTVLHVDPGLAPVQTPDPLDLPASDQRPIGDHLVEQRSLNEHDLATVRQWQAKSGTRFGEAALQLGLITPAQLDAALAQQYGYPLLDEGTAFAAELVAARDPAHLISERMRTLRTHLVLHWLGAEGARALTVVSTQRGEGRSFVVANLAASFAQMNLRTLAVDLDLRHPRLHALFGVSNQQGMSGLLAARTALGDACIALGGPLAVLPACPPPPNPQELLAPATLGPVLQALKREFDVLVIDSPAWASGADALLIGAQVDDALVITQPGRALQSSVREMVDALRGGGARVVGAVVNER